MNRSADQQWLALLDDDLPEHDEPGTEFFGRGPDGWVVRWARLVTSGLDQAVSWVRDQAVPWLRDRWWVAAIQVGLLAVVGVIVGVVLKLLFLLLGVLVAGVDVAGEGLVRLVHWLATGSLTRTIADPFRSWLDAHTTGLPATPRDLAVLWLVILVVFYLAALTGSGYGRVGWVICGAATVAVVLFGAPHDAGPVAAGVTATVWLLLSWPVCSRRRWAPRPRCRHRSAAGSCHRQQAVTGAADDADRAGRGEP